MKIIHIVCTLCHILHIFSCYFVQIALLKQFSNNLGEIEVVIDSEVIEVGKVYGLIVSALTVVVTYVNNVFMRKTVFLTVEVKRIILVVGLGCHIEGG